MPGKPMSDVEINTALEMARAKKSVLEIMRAILRSPATIRRHLKKNQVSTSYRPPDHKYNKITQEVLSKGRSFTKAGGDLIEFSLHSNVCYIKLCSKICAAAMQEQSLLHVFEKKQLSRNEDPRSAVCQKISRCSDNRCHMHLRCPAYQAYIQHKNVRKAI